MTDSLDLLIMRRDAASVLLTIGGERDGAQRTLPEFGWSHGCWLDGDTVLLGRVDRAEVVLARVYDDRVEPFAAVEPPMRWTHLVALGGRRVLWCLADEQRGCVTRIGDDGAIDQRGPEFAVAARYTHVLGTRAGDVVFAHAKGVAVAGAIDAEGGLRLADVRVEIPGGFDAAVAYDGGALFYRGGAGQVAALGDGALAAPRPVVADTGDVVDPTAQALVSAIERAGEVVALAVRPAPRAAAVAGPTIEILDDTDAGATWSVAIDPAALMVTPGRFGATLGLSGFRTEGDPGGPPRLRMEVRVVLPLETQIAELRIEAVEEVEVRTGPLQPVQHLATAALPSLDEIAERDRAPRGQTGPWMDADDGLFTRAIEAGRTTAPVRLIAHEAYGPVVVARFEICPVRIASFEHVALTTRLVVRMLVAPRPSPWPWNVPLDPAPDQPPLPDPAGGDGGAVWIDRGSRNGDILRTQLGELAWVVINRDRARELVRLPVPWEPPGKGYEYLIITDDTEWDPTAITPGQAVPEVTAAFRRLVAWKRRRGLRARVVTIREIVAGKYVDVRTGAVDLPEVIRRFVRWAQSNWSTRWLLLGGGPAIVPVRRVAVPEYTGWGPITEEPGTGPITDGRMRWASTFMQIHATRAMGVGAGLPTGMDLVRADTFAVIPFDAAGTSSPTVTGWFYATDATYATRSTTPTQFIRVNGPAVAIRTPVFIVDGLTRIPTDLYYSSIRPDGNAVEWDPDGNRLYIQGTSTRTDAVMAIDVSVGRAPVANRADADAFVDKLIGYEQLRDRAGVPVGTSWLGRGLLVAENWGGIAAFGQGPAAPAKIPAGTFRPQVGLTLLHLNADYDASYDLYAYPSATVARKLTYGRNSSARCWYYVNSETDVSASVTTQGGVTVAKATRWVAIVSTVATDLAPTAYVLNHSDLDGSTHDQEQLRTESWIPHSRLQQPYARYYADLANLPAQTTSSPAQLLGGPGQITPELQRNQHFVSLSGHGNPWYCCTVGPGDAGVLPADWSPAVYFADSCLTNAFDVGGSLGAALMNRVAAGAIGYVGNTREGFIGLGDDQQRRFWSALRTDRRLGTLNDTRIEVDSTPVGGWRRAWRWQMFVQNLLGDPETYVWPAVPERLQVSYVLGGPWGNPFTVVVHDSANRPVEGAAVHLRFGNQERFGRTLAGLHRTELTSLGDGVIVTVSRLGCVPSIETVTSTHPALRQDL